VKDISTESNRNPTSDLGTSHRRRGKLIFGCGLPIRPP